MPSAPPEPGVIRNETGAQTLVGYVLDVSGGDGCARCWLDIGPQHLNRHNVLHGGVATMMIDNACGATGSLSVDPEGKAPFLTVSMTTQFLAPGLPGRRVTATGRLIGGGKGLCYINAELVDDQGVLVATATGVFKRVRTHAPEGAT